MSSRRRPNGTFYVIGVMLIMILVFFTLHVLGRLYPWLGETQ